MTPDFVGPHEGQELELMLRGVKPLSMFVETIPAEFDTFPERDFDEAVSKGHLVKHVSIETINIPSRTEEKCGGFYMRCPPRRGGFKRSS